MADLGDVHRRLGAWKESEEYLIKAKEGLIKELETYEEQAQEIRKYHLNTLDYVFLFIARLRRDEGEEEAFKEALEQIGTYRILGEDPGVPPYLGDEGKMELDEDEGRELNIALLLRFRHRLLRHDPAAEQEIVNLVPSWKGLGRERLLQIMPY